MSAPPRILAPLLLANGICMLLIAWRHVELRDAWREHRAALRAHAVIVGVEGAGVEGADVIEPPRGDASP